MLQSAKTIITLNPILYAPFLFFSTDNLFFAYNVLYHAKAPNGTINNELTSN